MSPAEDFAALGDLGEHFRTALQGIVERADVAAGELTILVTREGVCEALKFARDDSQCRFESLIDLCGVDYPSRPQRFEIVYHLLSMRMNQRLRIKTRASEADAVPSIATLFPVANWFEREVFDMYGVAFSGHPDLRRILTDYGFDGHPLRKDFPLSGHTQIRYDAGEGRIVHEPVQLVQDYRDFDFLSPWEGARAAMAREDGGS